MFELTEIEVKLGFLRNTKETSFSLVKTFISNLKCPQWQSADRRDFQCD